jgi:hypothetical protein
MKKPRSNARLKTLHPAAQEKLWTFLKQPGNSYDPQGIAFVKAEFGIDTSKPALSVWHSWYPLGRELNEASTIKEEMIAYLKENPQVDIDIEALMKVGQFIMAKRALKAADPAHFIAMRGQHLREENLAFVKQKYRDSLESKIDAGLSAVHAEIKGNEEAEQLFKRIRTIVKKAAK